MGVSYAVAVSDLLQVVWVAAIAGIAVTALFSTIVYAAARSMELRREHRTTAASVFVALAFAGSIVFTALLIFGLKIMAS